MKRIISALVLALATIPSSAHAATGAMTGTVKSIWVPAAATSNSLIELNKTAGSTGTCWQPPAAVTQFVLPSGAQGDKMRQLLVSAQLAGKGVSIYWDEASKDPSGRCIVTSVALIS